jgi:hypothetical protein
MSLLFLHILGLPAIIVIVTAVLEIEEYGGET